MDLFANPLIDAATSCNDFDWRDLRKRPMSIYLGIQPGDLHLLRPLLNLFLEQAISLQTEELPEHNPALKHQVLMLLDEMTAPGKIPILAQAISYLPGYNVRLLLVIQAFSQLREVYGANAADTMMKSLAARVLYAPKDFTEASEISQELGMTTVRVKSFSKPRADFLSTKGHRQGNVSVNEQKRPLLLPQEVKELGRDREILLYEGLRPVLAKKNRYYEDPLFKRRLFAPPPEAAPRRSGAVGAPSVHSPPAPAEPAPGAPGSPIEAAILKTPVLAAHAGERTIDRDKVVPPTKAEDEPLTKEELDMAVESFVSAFKQR
jgi:type IV secretion system protein VirD4